MCKLLLNLKTSTPNYMLYGELGRYPLNVTVNLQIVSFRPKLIDGKQSKLSSLISRLLNLKTHGNNTFYELILLNQYLMTVDIQTFGILKNVISHTWLIESIKLRLTVQFKQNWHSTLQISPKALRYRLLKFLDLKNI